MKINGNKIDTTGIKFSSKTETQDPIKYSAVATIMINGNEYRGDYIGDIDDNRADCKVEAYLSLRANCKRNGVNI